MFGKVFVIYAWILSLEIHYDKADIHVDFADARVMLIAMRPSWKGFSLSSRL